MAKVGRRMGMVQTTDRLLFRHLCTVHPHRADGSYSAFAGRECSRALAKMSMSEAECNGNLEDLTESQLAGLEKWIKSYLERYPMIGRVVEAK